eukprot:scaffold1717_cov169-Amphora_coffeaeformis.AAC.13
MRKRTCAKAGQDKATKRSTGMTVSVWWYGVVGLAGIMIGHPSRGSSPTEFVKKGRTKIREEEPSSLSSSSSSESL